MSEKSSSSCENETTPDCTFCNSQATAKIAVKEVGRKGMFHILLCRTHYTDYRSLLSEKEGEDNE